MKNGLSIASFCNDIFFNVLKFLDFAILKIFFSFEIKNLHHLPITSPFIITANHFSFMDPPVLQAACPRRIIFFMTEKFYNPIWGRWFFKLMHCIPLRENTPYHIAPLKRGIKLLKEGKVTGIFPEGGVSRNGKIQDGRPGTLLLSQKTSFPIIPAFISGTYQALPRHAKFFRRSKIKVIFGCPVYFNDLSNGLKGKKGLERATKNLIQIFRDLAKKQD